MRRKRSRVEWLPAGDFLSHALGGRFEGAGAAWSVSVCVCVWRWLGASCLQDVCKNLLDLNFTRIRCFLIVEP